MTEVQNDPDRVLHPLRRAAAGRVRARVLGGGARRHRPAPAGVLDAHGPASVGWYMGNPGAFSYSHTLWVKGFLDALGSPHYYSAGSQDVNNRFAASALLYGSPLVVPIPDLARTEFLLMVGANPLVSHGSVLTAPRVARAAATRSTTAAAAWSWSTRAAPRPPASSSTSPIRPDADAWLLLSMLQVIFDEGLADRAPGRTDAGAPTRCARARPAPAEATEPRTGVEPTTIARSPATSRRRTAPRPTGAPARAWAASARSSAFLIDALNAVTGNLDAPAARSSAARRSRSTRSASASGSPPTARCARASAASPT